MKRRQFIASLGSAAAAASVPGLVLAQGRSNKMIFPSLAGGTGDAIFRIMDPQLRQIFEVPFVIDYRPGAGGMTGTMDVSRGPKDGSMLGFAFSGPMSSIPILKPELGFDPRRDLAPVVQLIRTYSVLMVAPDFPANDTAGLIAYAKSKPQGLNLANSGAGGISHLAALYLADQTKMNVTHVAYSGVSAVYRAVLGGEVDCGIGAASATVVSQIKDGKMKVIAVTSPEESPLLPGVAPVSKFIPGFASETVYGIVAPPGTPPEIVNRINAGFVKVLSDKNVQAGFLSNFCTAAPGTPAMYAKTIANEYAWCEDIIKRNNIKLT